MTADGLRLLQDLRRSLLEPPRQLRPCTVAATGDDERSGECQRHRLTGTASREGNVAETVIIIAPSADDR
jgi:hypothetical protein